MSYVTVSTKISRRLKELLDKYGIKPSPLIRSLLEKEVKKRMLEELEDKARKLSEKIGSIPDEEIAELIREDREGR